MESTMETTTLWADRLRGQLWKVVAALVAAVVLWAGGASSAAYLILRHGEGLGAAIMDLGAQLRNAAAPPQVTVETRTRTEEDRELDRKIAEGFEDLRKANEMAEAFHKKTSSRSTASKGKKR